MKVLDPFAGYRLASGHPFFHVALFTGSFCVMAVGYENSQHSSGDIAAAFKVLRWGHFVQIMLSAYIFYAERDSLFSEEAYSDDKSAFENLKIRAKPAQKALHRDGSWKLSARVAKTFSVFVYQGTVFYAQKALF